MCISAYTFIQYTALSTVLTEEILQKSMTEGVVAFILPWQFATVINMQQKPWFKTQILILVVFKSSHHKIFSYTSSFQAVDPSKWCLLWTYLAIFLGPFCSALVHSSLHIFPVSSQCCLIVPLHTKTFEHCLRLMNGHSTQCDTAAQFALSLYRAAVPCLCESVATCPLPRQQIDKTPATMHFCTHSEDDRPG